jgi:hypothetical protein
LKKEEGELKKLVDSDYFNKENDRNYKKAYLYIPTPEYSYVRNIVEKQPSIEANSKEIFNNLKIKLEAEINKKVPDGVLELREKFKDLEIEKN